MMNCSRISVCGIFIVLVSVILAVPASALNLDVEFDKSSEVFVLPVEMTVIKNEPTKEGDDAIIKKVCPVVIPRKQVALLLMDVWNDHQDQAYFRRLDKNVREKIVPLVQAARKYGIQIIHATHNHPIHHLIKPKPGELVLRGSDSKDELLAFLKKKNIIFLIYAGYTSNMCILNRPEGVIATAPYMYMNILVADASLAIELPETLESQLAHKMTIHLFEINGFAATTTTDVLINSLKLSSQKKGGGRSS